MLNINEYKGQLEEVISGNVLAVSGLIVVMGLVIVYLLYTQYSKQGFMPTSTMRMQMNDNALVSSAEHATASPTGAAMASPNSQASYFSTAVAGAPSQFSYDPNAAPGAPGSLGYQILNSPDFNCAAGAKAPNSAWDWMTKVATSSTTAPATQSAVAPASTAESLKGTKNDNQLSALLAGY